MMIPNRIIQTARSADLPLLGQASVANLRLLNPAFEYCFFDDFAVAQFISSEFPKYRRVFDSFPHNIQRFDFFRYLALYRFGGFYFDTDVLLVKPLEPLLRHSCVFPFEELSISGFLREELRFDWEIGNYAFGCEAGHPFLRAIIEDCIRALEQPAWGVAVLRGIPRLFRDQFHVLYSTGPGLITRTLAGNPDLQPSVSVLFPSDVCDITTHHRFGGYGIHLMQASWRGSTGFVRSRIGRLWERRRRRCLAEQSQALGPTRPGLWTSVLA